MGAWFQRKSNGKIISVGEAARRMDHDYMTNLWALRVEWLLNAKRPEMTAAAKDGSIRDFGEPQIKFARPAFPTVRFIGISNLGRRR
jgi:hypothetical protein